MTIGGELTKAEVEAIQKHEAIKVNATSGPLLVRVVDVDISFGQMIWLMIKLAIAAIPAAIIVAIIGLVLAAFFGGLVGLRP